MYYEMSGSLQIADTEHFKVFSVNGRIGSKQLAKMSINVTLHESFQGSSEEWLALGTLSLVTLLSGNQWLSCYCH